MHLPLKWHRMLAARIRQRNFASARLVAWRGRMRSAGDRAGLAETLSNLSVVAEITGDLAASSRYLSEAISLRRELGERRGEAAALNLYALNALGQGQLAEAAMRADASISLHREFNDTRSLASALDSRGAIRAEGRRRRRSRVRSKQPPVRKYPGPTFAVPRP